jgi:hypothetical protein
VNAPHATRKSVGNTRSLARSKSPSVKGYITWITGASLRRSTRAQGSERGVQGYSLGIACAGALLFVVDRAVKKRKADATEPTTVGRRFYGAVLPGLRSDHPAAEES